MKRIAPIIAVLLLLTGCGQQVNRLQNGDLVFVGLPMD